MSTGNSSIFSNSANLQELQRLTNTYEHTRPHKGSPIVDAFLRAAVKLGASDVHFKAGQQPRVRIDGVLRTVDRETVPIDDVEARIFSFLNDDERRKLMLNGSVDFAYELDSGERFRVNIFKQESGLSVAARVVPQSIPSFDELHIPPVVLRIADITSGLVLVSGTTGSGKSTTIAAIMEYINSTRQSHIITIEDPIEFLHIGKKCLINQREVGINVKDFPTALRALMREDPDVILIGEMRDAETFRAAIQAADTGHLVFCSIHASSAAQTIERVLNLFPEDEQPLIRQSLVYNLRSIICQKLLKSQIPEVKRVPAIEVLMTTPIVRKLISENNESKLVDVIRAGDEEMQSFNQSLYDLFKAKLIDQETGRQAAPNPDEYEMLCRGIIVSHPAIVG